MFSKVKRKSVDQLRDDFGEFPPSPLKPEPIDNKDFNIVFLSRKTMLFYNIFTIFKVFIGLGKFLHIKTIINELKKDIKEVQKENHKKHFGEENLTLLNKSIIFLFFIVLAPILIVLAPLTLICKSIYDKLKNKNMIIKGYYASIDFNGVSEIVVVSNKKERSFEIEGIITHEHMHIIQSFCFGLRQFDYKTIDNLSNFISRDKIKKFNAEYLFEINELEVRVHEIVISHYRLYKCIPTTFHEFISMFCNNDILSVYSRGLINAFPVKDKGLILFKDKLTGTRYSNAANDISINFLCFDKVEEKFRFLTETLPVMYSNLLIMYGAKNESEKFLRTVESFDQYTEIYKAPFIESD